MNNVRLLLRFARFPGAWAPAAAATVVLSVCAARSARNLYAALHFLHRVTIAPVENTDYWSGPDFNDLENFVYGAFAIGDENDTGNSAVEMIRRRFNNAYFVSLIYFMIKTTRTHLYCVNYSIRNTLRVCSRNAMAA